MATTIETSQRYRVNVSQTSTGKIGWECTVEMEGSSFDQVLLYSDALVIALRQRYPPEPEKKPALSKVEGPAEKAANIPRSEQRDSSSWESPPLGKSQS